MAVVNFPLPPAAADSRKPAPLRLIARRETQPDTRASFFCHAADFLSFLFFFLLARFSAGFREPPVRLDGNHWDHRGFRALLRPGSHQHVLVL